MSLLGLKDFYLEIAKGNVPKHTGYNKFGRNDTILSSGSAEDIWDGGGTYSFPATADCTHIVSSAAGDTSVTISVEGLDTNWAYVQQTKDTDASDGTTRVALDTALRRVFRMEVNETSEPTGNIQCVNTGGGTVYAQITAGNNQTLMAVYTVAADTTAYVRRYYVTINEGAAKAPDAVLAKLWSKDNVTGYVKKLKHVVGVESGGESIHQHVFDPPYVFSEKTDIWIECEAIGSAVTADVTAGFDLVLVDD